MEKTNIWEIKGWFSLEQSFGLMHQRILFSKPKAQCVCSMKDLKTGKKKYGPKLVTKCKTDASPPSVPKGDSYKAFDWGFEERGDLIGSY